MGPDSTMSGWYYAKAGAPVGQETGPLSWEELYLLARAGTVAPEDLVWNPKLPRGVTAGQMPGLFPSAQIPGPIPQTIPVRTPPQPLVEPVVPVTPSELPPEPPAPVNTGLGPIFPGPETSQTERAPGVASADLAVEGPAAVHETEIVPDKLARSRTKAEQRSLPWLVVLLALVLAAAGLVAYFLFLRDHTGSRQTTSTASAPTTTADYTLTPTADTVAGWSELNPAGDLPTARSGHILVYDPQNLRSVLFGGSHLGTKLGDIWALDLNAPKWTQIDPGAVAPSPRHYSRMVFDATGGKMFLFGGEDASGSLNDLWTFDARTDAWTELSPAGDLPMARFGHALAQEPGSRRLILFGGVNGATRELLNDLWAYDPGAESWNLLEPEGPLPLGRMWHSFVYDPGSRLFVLFGGYGGDLGSTGANLDDLWAYDPAVNRWTELRPLGEAPLARQGHTMVLDPISRDLLLFGGCDGLTGLGDTWTYDQAANVWTRLQPSGDVPPGREGHAMTYDSAGQAMILFGGYDFTGNYDFSDTWTYRVARGT